MKKEKEKCVIVQICFGRTTPTVNSMLSFLGLCLLIALTVHLPIEGHLFVQSMFSLPGGVTEQLTRVDKPLQFTARAAREREGATRTQAAESEAGW